MKYLKLNDLITTFKNKKKVEILKNLYTILILTSLVTGLYALFPPYIA